MKLCHLVFASGLLATAFGFAPQQSSLQHHAALVQPLNVATAGIDTTEQAQRDVYSMEEWARSCGAQTAPGFQIVGGDDWRNDYSVITNEDLPAGSPVLFVPAQMILSSSATEQEFDLSACENVLQQVNAANRAPLFKLMIKILAEYEQGANSPFFAWLNGLPRLFLNGVAMTDACFECLPPYASWLAQKERNNFSKFLNAARMGNAPLSEATLADDDLMRWAYNCALTRHNIVIEGREKKITPLADMLNHGTYPNCEITYDQEGNCNVVTVTDVPAGSPLTISLGDPSNPTPLFATYGFLDDDCPGIFCKAMHLQEEMEELQYGFKDLLFATETGDIAPAVWNTFLYGLMRSSGNENTAAFFEAVVNGDEETVQAFQGEFFPYTLDSMKAHVEETIATIDQLNAKANSYDQSTHPRVPIILGHNELVKRTFFRVKAQLDAMG